MPWAVFDRGHAQDPCEAVFDDGVLPRTPTGAVFDEGVMLRTPVLKDTLSYK